MNTKDTMIYRNLLILTYRSAGKHNDWHQVTAETIANCFMHAEFTPLAAAVGDSKVQADEAAAAGTVHHQIHAIDGIVWKEHSIQYNQHKTLQGHQQKVQKPIQATYGSVCTAFIISKDVKLSDFLKAGDQLATTIDKIAET